MIPRFEAVPLRCKDCDGRWTGYIASQCAFSVAIASIEAMAKAGCPHCGKSGLNVLIDAGATTETNRG